MCIAILKTKKGKISDEELRESFNSNRDGAGIAYTKNNKLYIAKGIFKVEDFIKAVREAEKICDNNMLIHCRIGTSGKKDKNNTHPFFVNKNVALIHNGIFNFIDVPINSKDNDTQIFIKKYLSDISTKSLMYSKALHNLIAETIGRNNKLVIMDNTGRYKIINEKQGHWKDDVWFSNTSYKTYTRSWGYYGYDYRDDDEYDKFVKWEVNRPTYTSDYKQGSLFVQQPTDRIETTCKTFKDYGLTNNDFYLIEEKISNLSFERFAALDLYPVLNLDTKELITYEEAEIIGNGIKYEFLEDVSEDLYDYYIDCLDSIREQFESDEVA